MTALPIPLPEGFQAHVKADDNVEIGQVIAVRSGKTEVIINIPHQLAISNNAAKKSLIKIPGESIEAGEIIAKRNGFLGLSKSSVVSQVSGTILRYERDSGNLVIKTHEATDVSELVSPVAGIVTLCDNKKIVIRTDKNFFVGVKAIGGQAKGELIALLEDDPYHLNAAAIGKIVVGRKFTREMLSKAMGIEVLGIIGSSIADADMAFIGDRKFETPIIETTDDNINSLREWKNKKVYMDADAKSIILLSL